MPDLRADSFDHSGGCGPILSLMRAVAADVRNTTRLTQATIDESRELLRAVTLSEMATWRRPHSQDDVAPEPPRATNSQERYEPAWRHIHEARDIFRRRAQLATKRKQRGLDARETNELLGQFEQALLLFLAEYLALISEIESAN